MSPLSGLSRSKASGGAGGAGAWGASASSNTSSAAGASGASAAARTPAAGRATLQRRAIVSALVVVVVVVVWLLAFFMPQSRKLTSLQAEQTSLQATVTQDDARLAHLRTEAQHVTQIDAMYKRLEGYVPASTGLYTYIHTISQAAASAGVTVLALEPSSVEPVTGTGYSAVPVTASVKGTYDELLAFLKDLYGLPRLTDVNALDISGGGPGTSRATVLSATMQLAIFTSQKAGSSGS